MFRAVMISPFFSRVSKKKLWNQIYYSTKLTRNVDIENIRNIGILAHIDAGKTTTTERMLYYAGFINEMGEVHHGNTVTDYMDQERDRGITITSAAITFFWKKNQFNLIDTPGHIDFTMEVEQTLNVLDGAVVILDASAGVEAQTLMVWRQADRYNIPRLIYINKMDRKDADVEMCCNSIQKKLEILPLLLQLPVVENENFLGIADLITMEIIRSFGKERNVIREPLSESLCSKYGINSKEKRLQLMDKLADLDDEFANKIISSDSFDNIPVKDIIRVIEKVTRNKHAVPVLLGSSYKNIGVQPLMDAIILYLPSPKDHNNRFSAFGDNFCGRVFKIKHDKQKGPLAFMRIYNGSFKKYQKIYNIHREINEEATRIYIAYADDFKEVAAVEEGNITVVAGLKKTMSGDLITSSQSVSQKAIRKHGKTLKNTSETESKTIFDSEVAIPQPVFFCSIEPSSMASQGALEKVLVELQREDPSLKVTYNVETGQTVLGGMGELHLEIIRDRIMKEYKLDVDLGPLQIAYRETPIDKITDILISESKIGNSRQNVKIKLSLIPVSSHDEDNVLKLDKTTENASNIASIFPKHLQSIKQGVTIGLSVGPKISAQVMNAQVMLHWFEVGKGTSETFISATTTQLIKKLLKESGTSILEPIMRLEIITPSEHVSVILSDLSRRRTTIENITMRGNTKVITADAPLSELMGYSTELRTLTSGTASFTAEFFEYKKMSAFDEEQAIQRVRGF